MDLDVRDGESGVGTTEATAVNGPFLLSPTYFLPYTAAAQWIPFSPRIDKQNGDQHSHHFAHMPLTVPVHVSEIF